MSNVRFSLITNTMLDLRARKGDRPIRGPGYRWRDNPPAEVARTRQATCRWSVVRDAATGRRPTPSCRPTAAGAMMPSRFIGRRAHPTQGTGYRLPGGGRHGAAHPRPVKLPGIATMSIDSLLTRWPSPRTNGRSTRPRGSTDGRGACPHPPTVGARTDATWLLPIAIVLWAILILGDPAHLHLGHRVGDTRFYEWAPGGRRALQHAGNPIFRTTRPGRHDLARTTFIPGPARDVSDYPSLRAARLLQRPDGGSHQR